MKKYIFGSIAILLITAATGYYAFLSNVPYTLGLDLNGGVELSYDIDTSQIDPAEVDAQLAALRTVMLARIERKLASGALGVLEPDIHTQQGVFAKNPEMIVELPGVTDTKEAVDIIGTDPNLQFKLLGEKEGTYIDTGLSGRQVDHAQVGFSSDQAMNKPVINLSFNSEGKDLFKKITTENVGKPLAIFLDGELREAPTIQQPIPDGQAVISGSFTLTQAKKLSSDLNLGALPLPITLVNTQTVGPSLGKAVLESGVWAGIIGLILVATFLTLWYRLPGLLACVALLFYVGAMLTIFKSIPVTLTAAGIAGFILSIGMAVDANVLIFERMREEIKNGLPLKKAVEEGFTRAWPSIRDSNISTIISAIVLFWFGSSLVKGFALTLGIGVLISMISAIFVTRTFLLSVSGGTLGRVRGFFFTSGFRKN